jgi:NTP pyrophosphatase (non-canonical NTP hydrolase)
MKITTFNDYQKEAVKLKISLNRFKEMFNETNEDIIKLLAVTYDGLGLGEAGEIQGKIKKIIRDDGGNITPEHIEAIKGELSDILWYISSMCDTLGIKMEDVATYNIKKLKSRRDRGVLHGSGDNR